MLRAVYVLALACGNTREAPGDDTSRVRVDDEVGCCCRRLIQLPGS